jgi:hypothetical protein
MKSKLRNTYFAFLTLLINKNNSFRTTRLLLPAVLIMLFGVNEVKGQITEGFESGLTGSYQTGNVTLGSGTWNVTNVMAGTTGVNSGTKSAQIQGATGSQIITPTITGGVGIISFYISASTASGAYQVNISSDNGTTWNAATGSPFTIGTSKTLRTITINNSSVNKIQIYRTGATLYVDDFSTTTYSSGTTPPTLTAAVSPTVDSSFDVTFTNANNWATNITGITVGGTTLATGAYLVGTNKITFTPSASTLLQTSGSKTIVVSATGFSTSSVTQSIGAGAASKLAITTQPTAPTINGGVLAAQPVVVIQDQYSNATTSTASVTAAVGSGTWTLGGTSAVAGVSGTVTFSGLTATSAAAVTGATITFTSGSLTSVTSGTFNIPVPAPSNNLCSNPSSININGGTASGTTIAATYTTLTSEPYTTYSDVWYSFTPSNSGNVTVSIATTNTDYDLYAFTSCPSSATSYVTGGNAATGSTTSESITFAVTSGTTYIIRVVNTTSSAGSTFTIQATQPVPTISSTGTLAAINTNFGTASSNTSFSVSGSNLAAGISINPPAGFQVSTSSIFASNIGTNGSPITISPTSGTVSATTIYVRIPSTTAVGSYSGNIALTTTGATTVNVATVSSTVSAIAPTIGTMVAINKTYGDADFSLTAPSSNSSGAFTYSSSDQSVATISGSTVTIVGAGTATITATQAANGNYTSGTKTASLTVNTSAPSLSSFNSITKNYGDTAFTLTAPTSNSSGAFTYSSSDQSVATISGSTVTIVGAGTATITATQAASGNYASGSTTATLTVNSSAPTISSFNSITKNYGETPFTITAPTSNSSGAFTYTSSDQSVATISGSTVTIVAAGTATITATQAASGNYASGSTTATLTVNTIAPTIGTMAAINKTYGDADFSLTAPSSNSSGAFTYSSSDQSVATISGSTASLAGTGTTTITATQAANGNYTSGSVTTTLTVYAPPTAYNVTGGGTYCAGGSGFAVGLSGSEVGVSYQLVRGGSTNVGTSVSGTGSALNFGTQTTAGNYTVVATHQTTSNSVAMTGNATISINALPTITLSYIDDVSPLATSFTIPFTTTTGSPDQYSISTANPNAMPNFSTLSNASLTSSPISVTIPQGNADQEYSFTLTVTNSTTGCSQTYPFSFHITTLAHGSIGSSQTICSGSAPATFTNTASATGAGTITYSWEKSTVSVNSGFTAINGAASSTYTSGALTQTTYFKRVANNGVETSDSDPITITVTPTNTVGSASSSPTLYINTALNDITHATTGATGIGTATGLPSGVTATWATNTITISGTTTAFGTFNYTVPLTGGCGSVSATGTITVNALIPTIGSFSISTKSFGDADFSLTTPTSDSAGAFTFTSSNASVATISGSTVTIVGAGTATIMASQAADGNFASGSTSATLTVNAISPTIGTLSSITKSFGDADFSITDPTSNSSGTFTYTSSNTSVATISGTTVTIVGAGTATITATQAANGNYTAGTTTATLTVNTIAPTLGTFNSITKNYGDANFSLTAPTSDSSGSFTFVSSNTSVASINGTTVTVVGAGTATITATQAANGNYTSGSTTATLTVNTISPTFGAFNSITKTDGDASFSLTAPTSNSSGAFTYISSDSSVASISGSTVTIAGVGSATITASQAANGNFSSRSTTTTITVNPLIPLITTTGTLNAFSSCTGAVSAEQNFSVSGINLAANISITAPSGYELSLTSGGSFSSTLTLTQTSGSVSNTTVYVRLKNNASNGNSGNIVCSSTNATSVNVSTGSASVGSAPVGISNAMNFDGSNDKITLNSNVLAATNEVTYELWIKPTYTSGILLAHENWNTGYIHFQFHGNQIGFDVNGGNDNVFNYTFNSNTWYHIAAVYSSTAHTLKFYVNGVLEQTVVNNSFPSIAGTIPITIGSWNNDRYYVGTMDEVRIWNVARTDAQIQGAMNSELSGSEAGLAAYFNFNQGTANGNNTSITSLTDNSVNNNPGTINNMALNGTSSNFVEGVLSNHSIPAMNQTLCANSSAITLTSNLSSGSGLTYQWYNNTTSSNSGGTLIANATSSSYTPPTTTIGTKYFYVVATNSSGCPSTSSVSGAVVVNASPTIAIANSAATGTYDANSQTTTLTYSSTTGNPTDYSITWNASPSNSFATVTNSNLSSSPITIAVPAGANTGTYTGTLTVRNAGGCTSSNSNFTYTIALNNGDVTPPTISHPSAQNNSVTSVIKLSENTAGVTTFAANENVTWSISGGSEANLFSIDPSNGFLSFNNPPNYNNPQDTAPYNSYVVEVTATDGSLNISRRTLTVTISPFCGNWGN